MIWEHLGDNRSGKTFINAVLAWEAYNTGRHVYANCPPPPDECILNFPHYHIDMNRIWRQDLYNCYVLTDESVETMDARQASSRLVREIGYFGYQATKRGVDWHYDSVRHKNIDPRIRLNPHYVIESFRIPRDPRKPLIAIKAEVTYRYSGTMKTLYFHQPQLFFSVYNDKARIPPPEENA